MSEGNARERLGSRLGFILLSAGCAIGIGNVWRFPYVAGESGGGSFVAIYLVCLALIGIPVLVMEFAMGRAAQHSIARLYGVLTPQKRLWSIHGVAGTLGLIVLMMFYTVVTGWMILYFLKSAAGSFAGLEASALENHFAAMLSSPLEQVLAMVFVCISSIAICACGLQKGLERVSKILMLALLALIIILSIHSLTLPNAAKGVSFYLMPDWNRLRAVGIWKVCVNAMNQAFFTLSLGIGSMAIFGSYIGRRRTLLGEALHVTALDTFVAFCAGLIVIPACFAYGIAPGQGPGLVFITLPNVFNHMAGGRIWGALFFLFMSFAALTTVLAVFEGILASIRDYTSLGRRQACAVLAVILPLLSLPCIFGFNIWRDFHPLGGTSNILDLEDFLVSNILLPLGGLIFAIYCCHRFGWGWDKFVAEANAGEGPRIRAFLRPYCAYILPLFILTILILGLCR